MIPNCRALILCCTLLTAGASHAQFHFLSESRTISTAGGFQVTAPDESLLNYSGPFLASSNSSGNFEDFETSLNGNANGIWDGGPGRTGEVLASANACYRSLFRPGTISCEYDMDFSVWAPLGMFQGVTEFSLITTFYVTAAVTYDLSFITLFSMIDSEMRGSLEGSDGSSINFLQHEQFQGNLVPGPTYTLSLYANHAMPHSSDASSLSFAMTVIPEPSSGPLLVLGAAVLISRRWLPRPHQG